MRGLFRLVLCCGLVLTAGASARAQVNAEMKARVNFLDFRVNTEIKPLTAPGAKCRAWVPAWAIKDPSYPKHFGSQPSWGLSFGWDGACRRSDQFITGDGTLTISFKDAELQRVAVSASSGRFTNEAEVKDALRRAVAQVLTQIANRPRAPAHRAKGAFTLEHYALVWLWAVPIMTIAVFLNYATVAGRWGSGVYLKLSDCWGVQTAFVGYYVALAIAGTGLDAFKSGDGAMSAGLVIHGLLFGAVAISGIWILLFAFVPFFLQLPKTIKGIFILVHFMLVRHPAEAHVPTDITRSIDRRALRNAIVSNQRANTWSLRDWITPRFIYEHRLFRARKLQDILSSDREIVRQAIDREVGRATLDDIKA